jgi:hypothetical protein
MSKRRPGKRQRLAQAAEKRARKEAEKKQALEEKRLVRDWSKANSALQLGYDRPVNRQAAKDISRRKPDSN